MSASVVAGLPYRIGTSSMPVPQPLARHPHIKGITDTLIDMLSTPTMAMARAASPKAPHSQLLAGFPCSWWDHVISLLGTGFRISELAGLQAFPVALAAGRLEVVETRYEAGRFGKGLKDRPNSDASVREVPLPARSPRRSPTNSHPPASRCRVAPARPHDLRHTYATWLEEAGIPARMIDELMGHAGGRRSAGEGSMIGRVYRHTSPEMRSRVTAALEARLAVMLEVAARLLGSAGL